MGFLKRIGERRNSKQEQTESEPSGWDKLAEEAHPTVAEEEIVSNLEELEDDIVSETEETQLDEEPQSVEEASTETDPTEENVDKLIGSIWMGGEYKDLSPLDSPEMADLLQAGIAKLEKQIAEYEDNGKGPNLKFLEYKKQKLRERLFRVALNEELQNGANPDEVLSGLNHRELELGAGQLLESGANVDNVLDAIGDDVEAIIAHFPSINRAGISTTKALSRIKKGWESSPQNPTAPMSDKADTYTMDLISAGANRKEVLATRFANNKYFRDMHLYNEASKAYDEIQNLQNGEQE